MVKPTVVKPANTRQKAGLKIRLLPSKSGTSLLKPVVKRNPKPYPKQKKVISTKKVGPSRGKSLVGSGKPMNKTAATGSVTRKTTTKANIKSKPERNQAGKKTREIKTRVGKKELLNASNQETVEAKQQVAKVGKKQVIKVLAAITPRPTTSSKVNAVTNKGFINMPAGKGGQITGSKSKGPVASKSGAKGVSVTGNQSSVIGNNTVIDGTGVMVERDVKKSVDGKTCRVLSADEVKKHVHLPPQVIGLFGLTRQTYTCLDCHSGPFLTRDQLNRHKHQCLFKSAGLKVACFTCNKLFLDRKALNEHQKNEHWNLKTILTPEEKELARQHVLDMKGHQYKNLKQGNVAQATPGGKSSKKNRGTLQAANSTPPKNIVQRKIIRQNVVKKAKEPNMPENRFTPLATKGMLSTSPKINAGSPLKINVGLATRITPPMKSEGISKVKLSSNESRLSESPKYKSILKTSSAYKDEGRKGASEEKSPSTSYDEMASDASFDNQSPRRSQRIVVADETQVRTSRGAKRSQSLPTPARQALVKKTVKENVRSQSVEIGQGFAARARRRLEAKKKAEQDALNQRANTSRGKPSHGRPVSVKKSLRLQPKEISDEQKIALDTYRETSSTGKSSGPVSKDEYMAILNLLQGNHGNQSHGIIEGRGPIDDDDEDIEAPTSPSVAASAIYYGCGMCGKVFKSGESLRVHREKDHKSSRHNSKNIQELFFTQNRSQSQLKGPKFCLDCGEQFEDRDALTLHKKSCPMAASSKVHACYVCQGESFFTREELQQHKLVCRGTHQIQCWQCGKTFMQYADFITHKMEVHDKKGDHQQDMDEDVITIIEETQPKKRGGVAKKRRASNTDDVKVAKKNVKASETPKRVRFQEKGQPSGSLKPTMRRKTSSTESTPDVRLSRNPMSLQIKADELQELMRAQGMSAGKVSMLHVSEDQLKKIIQPSAEKVPQTKSNIPAAQAPAQAKQTSVSSPQSPPGTKAVISPLTTEMLSSAAVQGKKGMVQVPAETWKQIVLEHQELQRQTFMQKKPQTSQLQKEDTEDKERPISVVKSTSPGQGNKDAVISVPKSSPKKVVPQKQAVPVVEPLIVPKSASLLYLDGDESIPSTSGSNMTKNVDILKAPAEAKGDSGLVTITTDGKNPYKVVVEAKKDGSTIQIRMVKVDEEGKDQEGSEQTSVEASPPLTPSKSKVTKKTPIEVPEEQTYVRVKRKAAEKASAVWEPAVKKRRSDTQKKPTSPKKTDSPTISKRADLEKKSEPPKSPDPKKQSKKIPDSPQPKSDKNPKAKAAVSRETEEPSSPNAEYEQIPEGAQVVMAKQANGQMVPMLLMPLNALGNFGNQEGAGTTTPAKQPAAASPTMSVDKQPKQTVVQQKTAGKKSPPKAKATSPPKQTSNVKSSRAASLVSGPQYVTVGEVVYHSDSAGQDDDDSDVISVKSEPDEEVEWDFQPVGTVDSSGEGEVEWYVASA